MNLITLQEYKDFNGIVKPDGDAKIITLISSVSALIQAYIGRNFEGGREVTEVLSVDYDTNTLYLDNYPVDSVLSVSEPARYTTDSTVHVPLTHGADYTLDSANGVLYRQPHLGGFANWPIAPSVVTVTYITGGSGGMSSTSDVPADLKLATLELVEYYKDKQYIQNRSIQGTSLTNTPTEGGDFPKHIQVILDRYK